MAETSINVSIAGRPYPITVKADEISNVRKAAELVSAKLKELQKHYAVRDKQDLLAMCALQLAVQQLVVEKKSGQSTETVLEGIKELDALVSDYLKKSAN